MKTSTRNRPSGFRTSPTVKRISLLASPPGEMYTMDGLGEHVPSGGLKHINLNHSSRSDCECTVHCVVTLEFGGTVRVWSGHESVNGGGEVHRGTKLVVVAAGAGAVAGVVAVDVGERRPVVRAATPTEADVGTVEVTRGRGTPGSGYRGAVVVEAAGPGCRVATRSFFSTERTAGAAASPTESTTRMIRPREACFSPRRVAASTRLRMRRMSGLMERSSLPGRVFLLA